MMQKSRSNSLNSFHHQKKATTALKGWANHMEKGWSPSEMLFFFFAISEKASISGTVYISQQEAPCKHEKCRPSSLPSLGLRAPTAPSSPLPQDLLSSCCGQCSSPELP